MSLIREINEIIRPSSRVPTILGYITQAVPVEEMFHSRGKEFLRTGFYQIRVKPIAEGISRDEVLYKLEDHFKNLASSLNLSQIQINVLSRNSSKFGSVSFVYEGTDFDIVVARGGNGGEVFEKILIERMSKALKEPTNVGYEFENDLVKALDKQISGGKISSFASDQAKAALKALRDADPAFRISNIESIEPRTGSTRRAKASEDKAGEIIGDMVITLKNGDKKYISIKSFGGKSVSQFGVSKAFNDDLSVNPDSEEWKFWLQPFGLDPKKVEQGLKASQSHDELPWNDTQRVTIRANKGDALYRIFERLWGIGYYYLRETRDGFHAFKVDKKFIDDQLLRDLTITEIRYPSKDRKQISIYAESKAMRFKIEVRNPRGRGSSRLTQIQLAITKTMI